MTLENYKKLLQNNKITIILTS